MSSAAAQVHRLPDGRAMGFSEFGDDRGRPLVFCHGFPGSRLAGALLDADARSLGLRVITPDRPGHGLSDAKRWRRVSHWTDDVRALADALNIDRFAVLGFSAGAPYAAACAALLPDRVAATGIVSGWPPPNAPKTKPRARLPFLPALGRHVRVLRRFALARSATRLARTGPAFLAKAAARAPEADRPVLTQGLFARAAADDMREAFRQGGRGPAGDIRALNRKWGFELESIRGPVWLWHGQEDRHVPPAAARFVAERIPGLRATFYRSDGHFSTLVAHLGDVLVAIAGTR